LIALTSIGCIIYLALETVLTRVMFRQRQRERKLDLFFPPKKLKDVCRGEVPWLTLDFWQWGGLTLAARGLEELFSSCAVVSVFWLWRELV
jgi:hypothetical protein